MQTPVVVIESGDFFCRGGLSINERPSVDFFSPAHQLRSINTVLHPGGWAHFNPDASNYTYGREIENTQELLWCRVADHFFRDGANRVALLDTRLQTQKQRDEAAEFFFESLNVPHLRVFSEPIASVHAMRHLKFFRVDPLSAKDRLLPHNDGLSIPFSPSFSGIVVTSDFQVLRMQPFLSGIPPVNGRYEHPLGERVPKAVLFSKLHEAHNNAYTRPFGATCSVHDTCCSTQNSNHCYKSDLEDISMDETVPESKCEKNREVRDIIEASSPRKDHLCCWRVSQFLYDQCCYVSFDPDMDSWLIEKRLAALHDTDASLYTCTCRSPHLHDIAEDIPHFAVCPSSRVGNCRNIHSKHYTNVGAPQAPGNTCCLCSVVTKNNSTYDEPEKRDTAAQDPFDNALGGRSLVPLQQSEWKRLLQSPSSTLEKKIRETLREYIFLSPEVLFQPKVILSSVYNKHLPLVQCENTFHDSKYDLQRWFPTGIAEAILSILNASPIDLRRDMYSNIILLGSMATLPFLPHRLVIDIQTGVYKRLKKSIVSSRAAAEALSKISLCVWTPVSHIEARYALWIGLNQSLKETCDTYGSLMSLTRDQFCFVSKKNTVTTGNVILWYCENQESRSRWSATDWQSMRAVLHTSGEQCIEYLRLYSVPNLLYKWFHVCHVLCFSY